MRRFKFSLESVLLVRNKTLEDERVKLVSIVDVFNRQREALKNLFDEVNDVKSKMDFYFENNQFNSQIISNYNSYLHKLSQDIEIKKKMLHDIEQQLKQQQDVVKLAYINVKSIENLKEKQLENFQKEEQLEEIKEIDDIVSSRRAII